MSATPPHVWAAHVRRLVLRLQLCDGLPAALRHAVRSGGHAALLRRGSLRDAAHARVVHGRHVYSVAAPAEGAAAGVGAAVVGPRPRAQQKQAINTKGNSAGHITAIATAGCWVQCVFDAFRMSWPSQGAWPQYWIEQPSRSLSLPHDPSSPQQQPAWGSLLGSPVMGFQPRPLLQPGQVYSQVKKLPSQ